MHCVRRLLLPLMLLLACFFHFAQAQDGSILIISEFMADNATTLSDEDGDYSDWIEIQNLSDEEIDLGGWYLSDDADNLIKWIFPQQTIAAREYLVVFASGKDRRLNELHTNFRLSGVGEQLFLTKPDGKTVASSLGEGFPPQHQDVSFAFINNSWLFADPTPGSLNETGNYLNPPAFSVHHGLFDQPFSLEITNRTNDHIIYTLDGSQPELLNGLSYSEPIWIDSTSVIRAIAVRSSSISKTSTSTFIFPEKVKHQPANPEGYPEFWGAFTQIDGVAIADYEMDPEISNNPTYKDLLVPALESLPTVSLVFNREHLFSSAPDPISGGIYIHTGAPTGGLGEGWERPASVEYFLPGGETGLQIDCGLRIHGGHSRVPEKNPKHSFRLVFRNEYGPEQLKYPILGNSATDIFNSLILRAGFNQTWLHWDDGQRNAAQYIHDTWAKDTWMKMGHTAAHNSFVHLYLNGMYWGLYNLSERMDDDFMAEYLGGNKEDYDVIKDYGEVAEGNKVIWNEMMDIAANDVIDAKSFYEIQGKNIYGKEDESMESYLDVSNLIDFMIMNLYAGNLDWDHHNWVAARNRAAPGNGFQFFPWDSERIFYNLNNNVVDENNEDRPSFLYNQLRRNPTFRIQFTKRANELLGPGGILSPDSVKAAWAIRSAEIELAVIAESARWGDYRRDVHAYKNDPYDLYTKIDHWDKEQRWLLDQYFPQRSRIVLEQLQEIGLAGDIITGAETVSAADLADSKVYPTPFSTQVNINFNLNHAGAVEVCIYSSEGKVVHYSEEVYRMPGQKQFSWRPGDVMNGIYHYQIRTRDFVYSGKLIYIH